MSVLIKGKCFQVGDGVTAYQIIAQSRWSPVGSDLTRLGDWLFENLESVASSEDGAFRSMGYNIVAAGENFGCGGKSNDYPVAALKDAGVELVIARSFNRIFYRNAINLGLPVVLCPNILSLCAAGDTLECDLSRGTVNNSSKGVSLDTTPLSTLALEILGAGGLIDYYIARRSKPESLFISK